MEASTIAAFFAMAELLKDKTQAERSLLIKAAKVKAAAKKVAVTKVIYLKAVEVWRFNKDGVLLSTVNDALNDYLAAHKEFTLLNT